MIYLVSKQRNLFNSEEYQELSPQDAIEKLNKEIILGADTETEGLDPYEKKILSIQLGTEEFQIVWDCTSYPLIMLKDLLENPNILFLWHNYTFDAEFLLKENIVQKNYFDTMIAERVLMNGYQGYSISLKSCALKYCNYDMDKSTRGEIITKGLTTKVIVYAGTDVKYLIPIYKAQLKELKEKDLLSAAKFESKFTIVAAYLKWCGVKLDEVAWKNKMKKDQAKREAALNKCNDWVLNFIKEYNYKDGCIECEFLSDSQYHHPTDKVIPKNLHFTDPEVEFNLTPGDYISSRIENSEKYGILYYNKYRVPFGFWNKGHTKFTPYIVKVNAIQLDLFSTVDTKFGNSCQINWSSSDQLIPLFKILGFNLKYYDKKARVVKESVGKEIIDSQKDKSPLAPLYLEFKKWETVCNAFGDKFLKARSKDGRIRGDWRSIGTDTFRMSCKGEVHGQKINMQQLPADAETRACFIAEKGNLWVSCDMSGQESRIMASLANDSNMIELLRHGDIHSYVARVSFSEIPNDYPIEKIKSDFHTQRQHAKKVEFSIAYGGDAHTIMQRINCTENKATEIYNAYMNEFPLVKQYQAYCKYALSQTGYVLMDNVTRAKYFIKDWNTLKEIQDEIKQPGFWELMKEDSTLKADYRLYKKEMSDYGRESINFRIQRRGSGCFKLASLLFFNYIVSKGLLNKVKFLIGAHDELNFEAPADIAYDLAKIYQKCVLKGSHPFCPNIEMGSDVSYNKDGTLPNHWVH